jgi:hypothetical protein
MVTPTNKTYSRPSGRKVYGGKSVPLLAGAASGIGTAAGSLAASIALAVAASASSVATGALSTGSTSPGDITTFALTSTSTQASAPFVLGHSFVQGDVPSGSGVSIVGATAQFTAKNTWPDGSVKFGVIAGTASLTANVPLSVTVRRDTASSGTALTIADLKTAMSGQTCSIACGAFGTASWTGTDWDTPFQTWVSGHRMSSFVYRKPVGADAHLVAWLEVRYYVTGAVEVLPWIENGYLNVASPTSKSATYSFTLGGTTRFSQAIDIPARCRTVLIGASSASGGGETSYWLGSAVDVTVRHNAAYLQRTGLVPNYGATVASNATVVNSQVATYAPLQQGNWTYPGDAMGGTGYSAPIGLLPEHDVLYLTCPTSSKPWKAVQFNAYSAGRYPIHYRDETTNRPLRFSSYPNTSTNSSSTNTYPPGASGTGAPAWDIPHHPSIGFMAYLLTGRWYFIEELQFAATNNYLWQVNTFRNGSDGIFLSSSGASTVRGAAWGVRTLAQAACLTPDADPLAAEFIASMSANVAWNHARYVAQANNPFGIVAPYGDAYGTGSDGRVTEAPWQQDFYTAAFGYALAMQPPIGTTALSQLSAFFAWKARSAIGRLGDTAATDWLYRDAAPYNFVVALVDFPDWVTGTGPWPASWGAMYQASYGVPNPGVTGSLQGGNYPEVTSYWGNLQPAIAYAVEFEVPGAREAYSRMINASNWATFATGLNATPVWSVAPSRPVWRQGMTQWEWKEIAGSSMNGVNPTVLPSGNTGPSSRISTWQSLIVDDRSGRVWSAANGGHGDYAGNEVVALDLRSAAPSWSMVRQPSPSSTYTNDLSHFTDGRPNPVHTYFDGHYIGRLGAAGKLMKVSGGFHWPNGTGPVATDGFDLATGDWDGAGTYPNTFWPSPLVGESTTGVAQDSFTGDIYYAGTGATLRRFNAATGTFSAHAVVPGVNSDFGIYRPFVYDHTRGKLFVLGDAYSPSTGGRVWTNNGGSGTWATFTFTGVSTAFAGANAFGAAFVARLDRIVAKSTAGATIHLVDPATNAVTTQATTGGTPPNPVNGVFGRFKYVPSLGGCVYYPLYSGNVWFLATE